jgi:transposase
MRPGIELRTDYDAAQLRALAKATRNAGLQTVRDWGRFNAHRPEGLIDGKAPGNGCKLQACHRDALVALVESGPILAVHGVVRWRLKDLVQWLWDEFRIAVSDTTLGRALRALGYRKLSARPPSCQKRGRGGGFKKSLPRVWRRSREIRLAAGRQRTVRKSGPGFRLERCSIRGESIGPIPKVQIHFWVRGSRDLICR